MQQITKEQLDSLASIAKAAAARASEALSKLIGIPVRLEMTRHRIIEIEHLTDILTTPQESVSAVILPIAGGSNMGSSALISSLEDSYRMAELVMKRPKGSLTKLDAFATSAVTETANIIGGSFLSVLSDRIGVSLVQSVPNLVTDTMQKVVDMAIIKLQEKDRKLSVAFEIDFALSITTTTTTPTEIVTHYVFILDVEFAQKILEVISATQKL